MTQVPPAALESLFRQVLEPVTIADFKSEFCGKKFTLVKGHPGKFKHLLPWDDLNSILEQFDLSASRVKLVREGKDVDPKLYFGKSVRRSRLNPVGLVNCLAEGATLIVNGVDELSRSVATLAEAFEHVLKTATVVNLYASWRTQRGFDLHWDDQDTTILQLSGRKRWKVYAPTRIHPLKDDVAPTKEPEGDPEWEGLLEEGDLVYLPRGYWHVAVPLDEPSLHLTVTTVPADSTDLLRWIVDQLKHHEEVRGNIPLLAGSEEQQRYVSRLKELVNAALSENVLDEFQAHWSTKIPERPRFNLPDSPYATKDPVTRTTHVTLALSRQFIFDENSENNIASFSIDGISGECELSLVPALKLLTNQTSHTIAELCSVLANKDSEKKLMILLTALSMRGVLQLN